jgi:hypothetical protein
MFVFRGAGIASGAICGFTTCDLFRFDLSGHGIRSLHLKIMLNEALCIQQEKIDAGKAKIKENRVCQQV